uniref:Transcription elongation factor n=1 Tax=Lepisosteus oculatus TaxID=7918 RepID=W5MDK3_LEPOC
MAKDQEVERIAKKLDKMVNKKNTDGAVDLLKELKNIKMSLETLQSTRIGMSVNAVRKQSNDEEVQTLAKSLIKSWKKLLGNEECMMGEENGSPWFHPKVPSGSWLMNHNHGSENKSDDKKKECSSSSSSSRNIVESSDQRYNFNCLNIFQRPTHLVKDFIDNLKNGKNQETPKTPTTPTTPKITTFPPAPVTTDSVRNKCRELLVAALQTDDDYKAIGTDCEHLAAQIEDYILCIYREFKSTDMKYKSRLRSRISNLKDQKNPDLRRSVLCGSISAERIATMTAEEMASAELKEMRKALTKESIREHQLSKVGGTETDMFVCGKCKKKNCTYTQVQTRSADEPMTTFVVCNECGNRWKFC